MGNWDKFSLYQDKYSIKLASCGLTQGIWRNKVQRTFDDDFCICNVLTAEIMIEALLIKQCWCIY